MAAKSETQVLTLLQQVTKLHWDTETALLANDATIAAILDAIAAGDDQPEDETQVAALAAAITASSGLYAALNALARAVAPTLARFAGYPTPSDGNVSAQCQSFFAYMIANSKVFKDWGLTKGTSPAAGGSNVGTGKLFWGVTGPRSTEQLIGHPETIRLECVADALGNTGVRSGSEQFRITGSAPAARPWGLAGAGGSAGDFNRSVGGSLYDWNARTPLVRAGGTLNAVHSGSGRDAVVNDEGGFESALTTDDASSAAKIANWTITAGATNLDLSTAIKYRGSQSLEVSGNAAMKQLLGQEYRRAIDSNRPYALCCAVRVASTVSDGDVIVRVKDDSTTYATLTVDTTGITDDTWTQATPVSVMLPPNIGANLRIEVEIDNYAGSGDIHVDEVVLAACPVYDLGYVVRPFASDVDFKVGDVFTVSATLSKAGKIANTLIRSSASAPPTDTSATSGYTDPS